MHKCGETPNKIDSNLFCGIIQSLCDLDKVRCFAGRGRDRHRSYRYALIHYRNAELAGNILPDLYKVFRLGRYPVVDLFAESLLIGVCTV